MKIKAYKLAVELGLEESVVLDWLKKNGYPNVKRADMIRDDVVKAAHKALGQKPKLGLAALKAQAQPLNAQAQTKPQPVQSSTVPAQTKMQPVSVQGAPQAQVSPSTQTAPQGLPAQPKSQTKASTFDPRSLRAAVKAELSSKVIDLRSVVKDDPSDLEDDRPNSGDASRNLGDRRSISGDASRSAGGFRATFGETLRNSSELLRAGNDTARAAGDASQTAGDASQTSGDVSQTAGEASQTAGDASRNSGAARPVVHDFRTKISELRAAVLDPRPNSGDAARTSADPREIDVKAARTSGGGSFAEMLEAHLGGNPESPSKNLRKLSATEELLQKRLQEAEATRDRYRAEADQGIAGMAELRRQIQELQFELQELRPYKAKAATLFDENAELQLDRTALRRRLQATLDELATLEQTCGELQEEIRTNREQLERLEADSHSGQMLEELENATQREMAWRARALELERATHLGANLPALMQSVGLTDSRHQAQVLAVLLQNRDTALPLLRAIRQVDHAVVEQLISQRIRRTCAHPVCEQVTAQDDRVALRVDDDQECEVCHGSAERRWFTRMVQECGWAGVKRLLVIGGTPESHDKLRALSQGQPIEIRLVPADDPIQPARVEGRVEGCDLLVLWSRQVVDEAISEPYAQIARATGRLVVPVLGVQSRVDNLARAVCNRLARNHVLTAD